MLEPPSVVSAILRLVVSPYCGRKKSEMPPIH
jgi:hypothetical protein